MSNFDFLKQEKKFEPFADVAISAEKIISIDTATCAINCRRAMEFAVKWMYSVDAFLEKPYQDNLISLMSSEDFREIVGSDLHKRMTFIRKVGNNAAHNSNKISYEQAELCLKYLHSFLDFVAYCYADNYIESEFDDKLLNQAQPTKPDVNVQLELDLKKLIAENKSLKEELTSKREKQQETFNLKPMDLSEYMTRKAYIDTMLQDAGWQEGNTWLNEVELSGMPNKSGVGYADYVLYDDAHKPLAVIEAKRTCVDVAKGRQQAKLYADIIEQQCGRRPVVFLTNGFDTRIIDNQYPERKVAAIYSKRDLEKLFNLQMTKSSLAFIDLELSNQLQRN